MITWIQIVLQKHNKPIFIVLLVAIVIAFVFTIGAVPFLGDRNRAWDESKDFYGFDLSNDYVKANLQNSAIYDAILAGANIRTQQQLTQVMLRQAYLLSVAKELGLNGVSEAEFAAFIRSAPAFTDAEGKFDAAAWDKFMKERGRMSEEALSYVLSQCALAAKMDKMLGGPGYLPASYIEAEYKKFYGKWNIDVATLKFDDFKADIKVIPAELEKFFKENVESYRIGEGAVLQTAFFRSADFINDVKKPTDSELSTFFGANMRKYVTKKNDKPYVPTLSEVKGAVSADYIADAALRIAAKKAEDFVMGIYHSGAKMGSPELVKFIEENKVKLNTLPLIRKTDEKFPEGVSFDIAQAGMALNEKTFFADPIPAKDGVWIVLLKEKAASYLPKLSDVKAKVEADYILSQKKKLFSERCQTLAKALKKAKDAKDFEKIAKEAKASISEKKDYVLATARPDMKDYALYSVLSTELPKLKKGEVSELQMMANDGYVVYIANFEAPKFDANNKDYLTVKNNLERSFSSLSANSLVSDMISKVKFGNVEAE